MKSRFTKAALSIVAVAAFAAPAVAQARHGSDDPASHVRREHQRFERHHRRDGAAHAHPERHRHHDHDGDDGPNHR